MLSARRRYRDAVETQSISRSINQSATLQTCLGCVWSSGALALVARQQLADNKLPDDRCARAGSRLLWIYLNESAFDFRNGIYGHAHHNATKHYRLLSISRCMSFKCCRKPTYSGRPLYSSLSYSTESANRQTEQSSVLKRSHLNLYTKREGACM